MARIMILNEDMVQINAKIPRTLYTRVKKINIDEGTTLTKLIHEFLTKYADEHDKSKLIVC